MMITQCNKVINMIHGAKLDYYHSEIAKAGKDSKTLFRKFNRLLNDNKTSNLFIEKNKGSESLTINLINAT